ncbi:FecR domain-containing protein [Nonomuraea sp. PA05]|uniref:FecR domain-containing protein n=1 Tax=Nonomuraea sp. PA05 TaxID=2604466 RepID=UPI0011D607DA|nr:FecR domain-containing protein [Nonomuraea sp. PA05]TYB59456.1 FecR domain-containing protein [Nonomuraea sp. PA05]
MATPRLISSVLALATLTTLGACSSGALSPAGGESTVSGVAGGGGAVPQTGSEGTGGGQTSAALTPEAYKGELESRREAMTDAITGLAGARGVKALDQRVGRAEEELSGAADALAALTPPEAVRTQHETYVTSLRDVATELGATTDKVGARDLCTSSAVLADLGDKLNALDQAGKELQSAGDYPADVVSVKAGERQSRRLRNGSFIRKSTLNGRSSLEIDNGSSLDAVITVVKGKSKVFSVYVRKKAKFKVRGVRDGSYKIYFTHGADWDGKNKAFTRDCSFERFEKNVKFKTTFTATQILWHDWRITLHSIAGGNVRTSPVDPDDFPG